jgi:hypothetical protein
MEAQQDSSIIQKVLSRWTGLGGGVELDTPRGDAVLASAI